MSDVLRGKVIVNTRALHQAAKLDSMIRAKNATPFSYPCIAIQPPSDSSELDDALRNLSTAQFDWLVLTSANTVRTISERISVLGIDLAEADFRIAVVGESTAKVVQKQLGLSVDLLPEQYVAEALAKVILEHGAGKILLPESAIARLTLSQMLKEAGADVQTVTAYETVCAFNEERLMPALQSDQIDIITFTSSSTVNCFLERLQAEDPDMDILYLLANVTIACIGSKTAATAIEAGLTVDVVPQVFSLDGMLTALETVLQEF